MEHFYRAQQNLSSLHKIGWRSAEKKLPVFLNMRILDLDFPNSISETLKARSFFVKKNIFEAVQLLFIVSYVQLVNFSLKNRRQRPVLKKL
jgi:hypothetical protein